MGRQGIAAVWVILLVTSTIILAPLAGLAFLDKSETEEQLENLKAYKTELEQTRDKLTADLKNLIPATGFGLTDDGKLPEKKATDFRNEWRRTLMPIDPAAADYQEIGRAKGKDFARSITTSSIYENISDLAQIAIVKVALSKQLHTYFTKRKAIVEERIKVIADNKPGYNDHAEKLLPKIQAWMQEIQKKMAEDQQAFSARKGEIDAEMTKIAAEVEEENSRHPRRMLVLKKDFDKQLDTFKSLLRTREQVDFRLSRGHVQGYLVAPNDSNKLAWITIGSKNRVVNGMHFLVATQTEKNKFNFKGEIEVKQTYLTNAEVEIVKVFNPNYPIVDSDVIVNPLMHKFRPLVLCLSGADKPPSHRFSIPEATRRLIEYGNEVLPVCDSRVDFLLWTDNRPGESEPTTEYWKAVELGIPIAKAKDLYKFLGE